VRGEVKMFARIVTLIMFGLVSAVPAAPQQGSAVPITVHLINAKIGKPIAHKPVEVWSLTGPGRQWSLRKETDASGVAVFRLTPPLPPLGISGAMGGYWHACIPARGYDLAEILNSGASAIGNCIGNIPNIEQRYHPRPGEVYCFAVHLTLLEHLTHCGEWGCVGSSSPPTAVSAAGPSRYSISILVVSGTTGRPIAHKPLMVYVSRAQPDPRTGDPYKRTELEADAEGQAVFGFDDPTESILVVLEVKGSRPCSAEKIHPQEVLQHGVVAQNRCDSSNKVRAKFTSRPGELVVFERLARF